MRAIFSIYIFIIAALIGIELSLGALVAPVVFFPQQIIGDGVLSHFQSGKLMSEIFVKYGGILIAVSIICLVFEMINFNNNKSQSFRLRLSTLMLTLVNIILALLFVLYFTDYVINAQKIGTEATMAPEFAQIHAASEWCMKLIIVFQTVLFFTKILPALAAKKAALEQSAADADYKIKDIKNVDFSELLYVQDVKIAFVKNGRPIKFSVEILEFFKSLR